ncbi:MAG: hypothetical protein HY985_01125 [Magnetospirillum sp.]|nr:hypothetical protein [Magnetospirillum sp.]
MITKITSGSDLLAIIVANVPIEMGVHFYTPDELSQQVAAMRHPPGRRIDAHIHNPIPRQIKYTQEVLIIRSGRLRVDFYDKSRTYLESRVVGAGDILILVDGGHGFKVLEELDMIEVKQGPHVGESDKTRFEAVADEMVVLRV